MISIHKKCIKNVKVKRGENAWIYYVFILYVLIKYKMLLLEAKKDKIKPIKFDFDYKVNKPSIQYNVYIWNYLNEIVFRKIVQIYNFFLHLFHLSLEENMSTNNP